MLHGQFIVIYGHTGDTHPPANRQKHFDLSFSSAIKRETKTKAKDTEKDPDTDTENDTNKDKDTESETNKAKDKDTLRQPCKNFMSVARLDTSSPPQKLSREIYPKAL